MGSSGIGAGSGGPGVPREFARRRICEQSRTTTELKLSDIRHSLTVSDLTPNVGLNWYFFTEMFDHFRSFFVGTFQVSSASFKRV